MKFAEDGSSESGAQDFAGAMAIVNGKPPEEAAIPATPAKPAPETPKEPETVVVTETPTEPKEPAEGQPKEEDPKKEEEATAAVEIPAPLKDLFPEAEDVPTIVSAVQELKSQVETTRGELDTMKDQLKDADEVLNEMYEVLDADPAFRKALTLVKNGVPGYEAMRQVLELTEEELASGIPDPKADPKKYDEYARRQIQREQKMRDEAEKQKKRSVAIQSAQREAETQRSSFQQEMKLSDQDMQKFLDWVQNTFYFNPETGKLPRNFLKAAHVSYSHDDSVKKAVEKAKVDAKNEIIQSKLGKTSTGGSGIPAPKGGGGKPAEPSEMEVMARSFIHQRRFVEDAPALKT